MSQHYSVWHNTSVSQHYSQCLAQHQSVATLQFGTTPVCRNITVFGTTPAYHKLQCLAQHQSVATLQFGTTLVCRNITVFGTTPVCHYITVFGTTLVCRNITFSVWHNTGMSQHYSQCLAQHQYVTTLQCLAQHQYVTTLQSVFGTTLVGCNITVLGTTPVCCNITVFGTTPACHNITVFGTTPLCCNITVFGTTPACRSITVSVWHNTAMSQHYSVWHNTGMLQHYSVWHNTGMSQHYSQCLAQHQHVTILYYSQCLTHRYVRTLQYCIKVTQKLVQKYKSSTAASVKERLVRFCQLHIRLSLSKVSQISPVPNWSIHRLVYSLRSVRSHQSLTDQDTNLCTVSGQSDLTSHSLLKTQTCVQSQVSQISPVPNWSRHKLVYSLRSVRSHQSLASKDTDLRTVSGQSKEKKQLLTPPPRLLVMATWTKSVQFGMGLPVLDKSCMCLYPAMCNSPWQTRSVPCNVQESVTNKVCTPQCATVRDKQGMYPAMCNSLWQTRYVPCNVQQSMTNKACFLQYKTCSP